MIPRRVDWGWYPQIPADIRQEERGYLSAWLPLARGRDSAGFSALTSSTRASYGLGYVGQQFQFTGAEFTYAFDWTTRASTTYECWLVVLGSTISSASSALMAGAGGTALIFNTTLLRLDVAGSTRITNAITGAAGDSVFVVGETNNYKLYHRAAATGAVTLYTGSGAFGGVTLTSAMQRTSSSLGFIARWTNRTPTEAQIYGYLAKPWSVFAARQKPSLITASAGGEILAVDDATHGQTADAISLSSASALSAADATHGHSADALTLSTASVLSVQDANQAHAAEGITLTASGSPTLTVSDATHAHQADALALSAQMLLAVQAAQHLQTAENVVLYQPGGLASPTPGFIIDAAHRTTMIGAIRRTMEIRR